jgi:hypothetical protein
VKVTTAGLSVRSRTGFFGVPDQDLRRKTQGVEAREVYS